MHVAFLKFSSNQSEAPRLMAAHQEWIRRGFADGVFLLAGSLEPGLGGAILAHGVSLPDLQRRLNEDPFVTGNVVTAEIFELDPGMTDPRLQFLLNNPTN